MTHCESDVGVLRVIHIWTTLPLLSVDLEIYEEEVEIWGLPLLQHITSANWSFVETALVLIGGLKKGPYQISCKCLGAHLMQVKSSWRSNCSSNCHHSRATPEVRIKQESWKQERELGAYRSRYGYLWCNEWSRGRLENLVLASMSRPVELCILHLLVFLTKILGSNVMCLYSQSKQVDL